MPKSITLKSKIFAGIILTKFNNLAMITHTTKSDDRKSRGAYPDPERARFAVSAYQCARPNVTREQFP